MPRRDVYKVTLQPLAGARFQPTGFPDLGAAEFRRFDSDTDMWQDCLLVESAQSMANHLEATLWDPGSHSPIALIDRLPYVRVLDKTAHYLTSSRTEAHRLASAFVRESKLDGKSMSEVMSERFHLAKNAPVPLLDVYRAIFALDPLCLLHGVFFAIPAWPAQPKVARALTSFVEAYGVEPAMSGGVKRDDVARSKEERQGASEGYGFVPFHRVEYVARRIVASFVIDLDQLTSYGLPEAGTDLLVALARYEIRSLLDDGFRPRTACDLTVVDIGGTDLPGRDQLAGEVQRLQRENTELLGSGVPVEVVWESAKLTKAR